MKNNKKGCFLRIFPDPSGERKDYVIEMGNDFDCFCIAVDFADLVSIKNQIIIIEERAKQNERDFDEGKIAED